MPFFTVNRYAASYLVLLASLPGPAVAARLQQATDHPAAESGNSTGAGTASAATPGPVAPATGTMTRAGAPDAVGGHPDPSPLIRAPLDAVTATGHRLLAVGAHGLIILSDDDGVTWRQGSVPVSVGLTGIHFEDDHVGWAIGHDGVVLRTQDGGEHWTLVQDGKAVARAALQAAESGSEADSVRAAKIKAAQALIADPSRPFVLMQVANADTVRLIGTGELSSETTDGGKTWRPWFQAINNPAGSPLYGLAQRDGVLVLVGSAGKVLVGRPEDGLHPVKSPGEATLFGVLAVDDAVLVYGQQGHVYESAVPLNDQNQSKAPDWRAVPGPSQATITAGLVRRDGSILLADTAGMIWRLVGKNTETKLTQTRGSAPTAILDMVEATDKTVVAVGSGGVTRVPATMLSGQSDGG